MSQMSLFELLHLYILTIDNNYDLKYFSTAHLTKIFYTFLLLHYFYLLLIAFNCEHSKIWKIQTYNKSIA